MDLFNFIQPSSFKAKSSLPSASPAFSETYLHNAAHELHWYSILLAPLRRPKVLHIPHIHPIHTPMGGCCRKVLQCPIRSYSGLSVLPKDGRGGSGVWTPNFSVIGRPVLLTEPQSCSMKTPTCKQSTWNCSPFSSSARKHFMSSIYPSISSIHPGSLPRGQHTDSNNLRRAERICRLRCTEKPQVGS